MEAKVDKNEVHLLVENKLINYQDYLYMRPNQLNEVDEDFISRPVFINSNTVDRPF